MDSIASAHLIVVRVQQDGRLAGHLRNRRRTAAAITGVPHAIASSSGNPNPSYKRGIDEAAQRRDRAATSCVITTFPASSIIRASSGERVLESATRRHLGRHPPARSRTSAKVGAPRPHALQRAHRHRQVASRMKIPNVQDDMVTIPASTPVAE